VTASTQLGPDLNPTWTRSDCWRRLVRQAGDPEGRTGGRAGAPVSGGPVRRPLDHTGAWTIRGVGGLPHRPARPPVRAGEPTRRHPFRLAWHQVQRPSAPSVTHQCHNLRRATRHM